MTANVINESINLIKRVFKEYALQSERRDLISFSLSERGVSRYHGTGIILRETSYSENLFKVYRHSFKRKSRG